MSSLRVYGDVLYEILRQTHGKLRDKFNLQPVTSIVYIDYSL